MADPRFFKNQGPFLLAQIVERCEGRPLADCDMDISFDDVAALSDAGSSHISFFDNIKYKDQFLETKAGAVFVSENMAEHAPENCLALVSSSPYKSYALAAQLFYPLSVSKAGVSEHACIDPSVEIGDNVQIEAGAIVGPGVRLGDNVWIEAGCVLAENISIGPYTRIGANASLTHCDIGAHVHIYPGVRIGQDGFGFAVDPSGHVKVPQLGRVIIEDHVNIGANTTIDRGAGPDTIIGQGTWIDNLVQIGHNVKIGRGCIIVAQVGISGSTVIEDFVAIGGQAGVAGHLTIGTGAQIAAQSGIMRDVPPGAEQMGYPALDMRDFMRQTAALKRLIKRPKSS
jgi:UDP-3-O-[3-hydroxymyristoyl] glucosamine N-acyltransferase